MTFRLERILDYKINGVRDVTLIFESDSYSEVNEKFHALVPLPHFGQYQIIREEFITSERIHRNSTKDNQVKS